MNDITTVSTTEEVLRHFDRRGFDQFGINRITGTKFNKAGYDKDGFNRYGRDKSDYDRSGYNWSGVNREGYDRFGFQTRTYAVDYGLNKHTGTDLSPDGYNFKGFDAQGFDHSGWDRNCYGRDGFNMSDYDRNGYHRNGFNKSGWNREGINRWTGTAYDSEGWNIAGYGIDGYNRSGYDCEGYDRNGYDRDMRNREGNRPPASLATPESIHEHAKAVRAAERKLQRLKAKIERFEADLSRRTKRDTMDLGSTCIPISGQRMASLKSDIAAAVRWDAVREELKATELELDVLRDTAPIPA